MSMIWMCPICKENFDFFEVLDSEEHRIRSLAPHLFITHHKDLTITLEEKS